VISSKSRFVEALTLARDAFVDLESRAHLMDTERDDLRAQITCLAVHVRQAEGEKKELTERLDSAHRRLREKPLSQIPYDHLKAELARRDANATLSRDRDSDATLKGRPWTREEEERLVRRYASPCGFPYLSRVHQREWQAIVLRLYRLLTGLRVTPRNGIDDAWLNRARNFYFGSRRAQLAAILADRAHFLPRVSS
jgi:hypothetical protein